jgi:hypothetical protein
MGAEMIIYSVPYKKGLKPDWAAGKKLIEGLVIKWVAAGHKDAEDTGEILLDNLEEFKALFIQGSRETAVHEFGDVHAIISGGSSWGDEPTEACGIISNLDEYNILKTCGFYPVLPDYQQILEMVLDKAGSTLLPLLTGLDPDLDEIVKEKLK